MSSLWICFSLLCAATIIQSTASNGEVSLKYNDTVDVVAGQNVTLNCSIINEPGQKCKGVKYCWRNSRHDILCDSSMMKSFCGWDSQTSVYLTISNVTKEENFTVIIQTNCGFAETSAIKVRVQRHYSNRSYKDSPLSHHQVIIAILGLLVTFAVVGILYFLFGTNRGRQIISRMKDTTTRRRRGDDDQEMITC